MAEARLVLTVVSAVLLVTAGAVSAADPFAFFRPWIAVDADARQGLDRREIVVRTLPSDDGHVAVFAAARIDASPARFTAWARRIEQLRRNEFVDSVGRFSTPPSPRDVEALTLDNRDLDDLRNCQPGRCEVKLAAHEIAGLREAIARAGTGWREAAQAEFRRLLLARVSRYLSHGWRGLAPYVDRGEPLSPQAAFAGIMQRSPYLVRGLPELAARLEGTGVGAEREESYFYWSKDRYGVGKDVVSVSHVRIQRTSGADVPAVIMTSQQILATHYYTAALGLTALTCANEGDEACYLIYVNRSQLDLLNGMFGGIRRMAIEQHVRRDTPRLLTEMRRRIESGLPPAP